MKKLLIVLGVIAAIVAVTPSTMLVSCNNGGKEDSLPTDNRTQPVVDSIAVKDTTVKN